MECLNFEIGLTPVFSHNRQFRFIAVQIHEIPTVLTFGGTGVRAISDMAYG